MHIEKIVISNFKSIKHLELSDFKRINLFIGRPNVGKSNIIEALSVFTIPQLKLRDYFFGAAIDTFWTRITRIFTK